MNDSVFSIVAEDDNESELQKELEDANKSIAEFCLEVDYDSAEDQFFLVDQPEDMVEQIQRGEGVNENQELEGGNGDGADTEIQQHNEMEKERQEINPEKEKESHQEQEGVSGQEDVQTENNGSEDEQDNHLHQIRRYNGQVTENFNRC